MHIKKNVVHLSACRQKWRCEKVKVCERSFADDVLELAREILVHVCGESCHKYSGQTSNICRHGFYYIVALADC